jgi:hypothetical protein
VRENLVRRAHQFNLMLDDVSITHVAFSPEFTHAVEGSPFPISALRSPPLLCAHGWSSLRLDATCIRPSVLAAKQIAQQTAQRAAFLVDQAIQEKQSIIVRAQGEAKSAELIGEAVKANKGFLSLRRLEAAVRPSFSGRTTCRSVLPADAVFIFSMRSATSPTLSARAATALCSTRARSCSMARLLPRPAWGASLDLADTAPFSASPIVQSPTSRRRPASAEHDSIAGCLYLFCVLYHHPCQPVTILAFVAGLCWKSGGRKVAASVDCRRHPTGVGPARPFGRTGRAGLQERTGRPSPAQRAGRERKEKGRPACARDVAS